MTATEAPNRTGTNGASATKGKAQRGTKVPKAIKAPPPTRAEEILGALETASKDREIDKERFVTALEEAVATAARRVYRVREMAAHVDLRTGDITAWTPYRIVEKKTKLETPAIDPDDVPLGKMMAAPAPVPEHEKEAKLPWIELLPDEAKTLLTAGELADKPWEIIRDPDGSAYVLKDIEDAQPGDEIRYYRSTEGLGRIAAQSAKQVLYQKVREAERDKIYDEYIRKVGELITGTVKRFEKGNMIVDLGKTEAVIPKEQQSRAERYTQGERVRGVLVDVQKNQKGAQLILSRTSPELLKSLMRMEVPEIYDGSVVIRGCVRHAGERAKVAVSSRERDVDPVGACVGMRGARVQAIMRELRGERIDIIQYSEDLVTYAQYALSPAKITRVSVMPMAEPPGGEDEQEDRAASVPVIECLVEDDQLSLAIGKKGQNVKLASELIGARIDIKSEQVVKAEVAKTLQLMMMLTERRKTALTDIPGLAEEWLPAFADQGVETAGDFLEIGDGDSEEEINAWNAIELDEATKEEALEAVRDFVNTAEEPEDFEAEEENIEEETQEAASTEGGEEAGEETDAGEEAEAETGGDHEPEASEATTEKLNQ
jgi:N utilization substance protein A